MRATSRMNRAVPVAAGGGSVAGIAAGSFAGVGYSTAAPIAALILIAIVATRVHEVLPFIVKLRPALTLGLGGALIVFVKSGPGVFSRALAHPAMRLLIGLFLWASFTAPFSLWPSAALSAAASLFLPIILMALIVLACEPNEKNLRLLKMGFVVATAVHGFLLLPGRLVGYRLGSVALDPNDLATLMVIAFPFTVTVALQSRAGPRRWMAIGAALICLTVVVFTGSRGGTIALVAAGIAYIFASRGSRRALSFVVLLTVGALTWTVSPPWFRSRIRSITSTAEDYNTTSYDGRKQIWARARGYIREHPVSGVGMNNFSVAEGNHLAAMGLRGKWSTTHNTYLQVTSELGFVGAALFAGVLGLALVQALALCRPAPNAGGAGGEAQPEFFAALAGFAAGAYFLSHAYFYAYYALVMMTFFAYVVRQASQQAPVIMSVAPEARSRGNRGFRSLRTAHISR